MDKHAVVRHQDGHDTIVEVLPSEAEAEEWAEMWREQVPADVTYTVVPYATLVTE